jgi:hypothetical protein
MRVLVLRATVCASPGQSGGERSGSPARSDSAGLPANGRTRMKSDPQW